MSNSYKCSAGRQMCVCVVCECVCTCTFPHNFYEYACNTTCVHVKCVSMQALTLCVSVGNSNPTCCESGESRDPAEGVGIVRVVVSGWFSPPWRSHRITLLSSPLDRKHVTTM